MRPFLLLLLLLLLATLRCHEQGLTDHLERRVEDQGDDASSPEVFALKTRLNKGLLAIQNMKKALATEFMLHNHTHLFEGMVIEPTSKDVFVAKHFRKILEGGSPFKYVFHGTSVTAGHDNWFKDAYPAVVESLLKPVYEALEVGLEVFNIAEGNNDCYPHNMCGDAFVGEDVDVISWEQSMNCGRGSVGAFTSLLLSVRKTSEAPLMVIMSGLGWASKNNSPPEAWAWVKELSRAKHDGFIFMNSIWAAGKYISEYEFSNDYFRTDKPFGGVKWHPGSHGHRLWGAYQAYQYASMIEDGLQKLHEQTHKLKRVPTTADMKVPEMLAKYAKDSPLKCFSPAAFGQALCQPSLSCYTAFQPMLHPERGLYKLIDGVKEDEIVREAGHQCQPTIRPSTGDTSTWKLTILPTEVTSTLRMKKTHCIDEKWIWAGSQTDGPLVLQTTFQKKGNAVICSSQGPWGKYPKNWAKLSNQSVVVTVDGQAVELDVHALCVYLPEFPAGHHTIKVTSKDDSIVNIAHVLLP